MKFKPVLSLILAVIFIYSLGIPVFATQNDVCEDHAIAEQQIEGESITSDENTIETRAIHVCDGPVQYSSFVGNTYKDKTATSCTKKLAITKKCSTCSVIFTEYQWTTNSSAHISTPYDATCNGTTQTLYNWCHCCHYYLANTTQPCPAGPHTGGCNYLPA